MVQAIQVLRFHLLELEKVSDFLWIFNQSMGSGRNSGQQINSTNAHTRGYGVNFFGAIDYSNRTFIERTILKSTGKTHPMKMSIILRANQK